MSMTGKIERVEVITSVQRRRRWSAEEKAAIVQETYAPEMSVSLVARRHGIAPNQLFTWRRLYASGALMIGDPSKDVGEPGLRISATELGRLDQRVHGGGPLAAAIGAGEDPRPSTEGDRAVILPMSGRKSKSAIGGTHSTGAVFAGSMLSDAWAARSFTSRWRTAWSSWWRHGCWTLPCAPGWRSARRVWRYQRWSSCIIC